MPFAERSLEVAPNEFLPHLLLGHNSEVLWPEDATCKTAFELWAPPPVAFLHIIWLTKPIPEAKEEQKLLDGLSQASGGQRNGSPQSLREQGWYHPGSKFLPPHLRNFKPQPLSTLGFVRVFPKFIICLDVLLGYEKAGGCGLFLLSTALKAG